MKKRLRTAPFSIDADAIARGLLDDIFTEEDRTVLRFGMLPADKMACVEKCLREKFLENATAKDSPGDQFTALFETAERRDIVDFSMKALISEATHEIALALYAIGDLVV